MVLREVSKVVKGFSSVKIGLGSLPCRENELGELKNKRRRCSRSLEG